MELNLANIRREQLIRSQNRFEMLNALMSFEIEREGTDDVLYLWDDPNMPPSEDLFYDAMKKLIPIIKEKKEVRKIKMVAFVVHEKPELFTNMGFRTIQVPKFISNILGKRILNATLELGSRKTAIAVIDREEFLGKEEFLKRFGNNPEAE